MSQRRGARSAYGGAGGSPAGPGGPGGNAGARGALLLAVAVVLGIVLLQQFDSGIDTGGQVSTDTSVDQATTTTRRVGLTTVTVATTTTVRARPKAEVKVLVANGSGIRGLAGATSNALKGLGYSTLTPTDATATIDKTTIQFADGWEAEAREVAGSLSLPATVVAKLASPPVAASDIGDAKVIVVLGADAPTAGSTTTAPAGATTSTTRRPG